MLSVYQVSKFIQTDIVCSWRRPWEGKGDSSIENKQEVDGVEGAEGAEGGMKKIKKRGKERKK